MASPSCGTALALAVTLALPFATRAESEGGAVPLDDPTLIALAVALAVSPAPQAVDEVAGATAPARVEPQLELVATVRAKSLVFEEVPKVNVTFTDGRRRTAWKTERSNLPARVEPGVVYRDVAVRLTLTSTMEDMAVLLRDARSASRGLRLEPEDAPAVVPASVGAGAPPAAPRPPAEPAAPNGPGAIVPDPANR